MSIYFNFLQSNSEFKDNMKTFLRILTFPIFSIIKAKFFFKDIMESSKIYIRQYNNGIGIKNFPNISEDWIYDNKNKKKFIILCVKVHT